MITVLAIGDVHIKNDNLTSIELFHKRIKELLEERSPDMVIVLGDILHYHERLDSTHMNIAYCFVKMMREFSPVYILVGNHDMKNNQQFLTENHWMNGMKEWNNVTIVDNVTRVKDFVLLPYVPVGRFEEALNRLDWNWKDAKAIFCHQEFLGCKMGAKDSVDGDKWNNEHPMIISGHIHDKQRVQKNIYYTGSSMQHAFGETANKTIGWFTFAENGYKLEEIDLKLPKKKIVYLDVDEIEDYVMPETDTKLKLTVSGTYEQFKTFKKTKRYKNLLEKGANIIYKHKKNNVIEEDPQNSAEDFDGILAKMISEQRNAHLLTAYNHIFHGRDKDEIIILNSN